MLGELVDTYCGGSIQALVMNIIKAEQLSEDELLKLKQLADDAIPRHPCEEEPEMSAFSAWCQAIAGPVGDSTVSSCWSRSGPCCLTMAWLAHAMLASGNPRWRVALRARLGRHRAGGGAFIGPSRREISIAPCGTSPGRSRAIGARLNRLAGIKRRRRTRPGGSRSRHSIPSGYLPVAWTGGGDLGGSEFASGLVLPSAAAEGPGARRGTGQPGGSGRSG